MEVFTDVDKESIRTGPPAFRRPTGTKTGSELCIAVTSKEGQVLTALYSVLVTLLFVFCWKLVSMAVISNTPKYRKILRGVALVGFWNAREPLEATSFLCGYLARLREVPPGDPHIGRPAIWLLILALMWLLGTYAASILVAAELIAGKVAPANPNKVYVPRSGKASADIMRLQALRAPATLRSLGSAEAASSDHTMRQRVSLNAHLSSGDSPQYFTYQYTVEAHDMGLQKWHDLKQEVSGRCNVDGSWFSEHIPEEDLDVYRPWGLANQTVNVVYDGERKTSPRATAIAFPYDQTDFLIHQAVEHRYGIIPRCSHRASHRPGTDAWYLTEPFKPQENDTDARMKELPGNRVKGGRPALSCTQKDVWSYNGTRFKNIYELTDEANLKFPDGWATQLQLDFGQARIIDVVNSAGSSSLVSAATFVGDRFDAETASIEKDMIRLFTATWISSAHTFRNMLMVSDQQNIPNAARNGAGKPQDGVDLFVVSTPQVATLRLSVLVTIPVLLVISILFMLVVPILRHSDRGKSWHEKMQLAEGAYLFARTQDPAAFGGTRRMGRVVGECVRLLKPNPGQGAAGLPNHGP
ncbi:hypothetical protein C7212DRAFT_281842 [Tuber magnatum]|uniref:Uncharacterized protein n=1 Tax=Tuber magnatum TaxID=42249 RepID=A0A317SQT5_9PEZI|nr:hypothetical protein C7212DRAFT_281842 [Tuber magnatum]